MVSISSAVASSCVFCSFIASVASFFSIGYHSGDGDHLVRNDGMLFKNMPSSQQVADIYCRLGGLPPILSEDKILLPTTESYSGEVSKPIILSVDGGVLPRSVTSVVGSSAFPAESVSAPSLQEVVEELRLHGVEVDTVSITARGDRSQDVATWISAQQRPVVILHNESPAPHHFVRALADSGNSTDSELTEFQISQYQICLWAGVIFVLIALASICSIANMEVIPDSLLYAKFQSGRTGNRTD